MRAGRLRHRVVILRKVDQVDTSGGHVQAWEAVFAAFASVEYLSGREYFEAGSARGEVDVRVILRSGGDVRISDRVQHGDRLLDVQTPPIDKTGRGREVELMCKEYVA